MSAPRITLLGSHDRQLRNFLQSHEQSHERAAAVLFRRFARDVQSLGASDRYVAVDVVLFDSAWVRDSSPIHIAYALAPLRELFRRCEEDSLVFGFAHNHPGGPLEFSDVDERNEQTLLQALSNRNGPRVHLVALLLSGDKWIARVRQGEHADRSATARHVLALGDRVTVHRPSRRAASDELYARQAAAFGAPFVQDLHSLRIGIVGAGGTGSPTATLLARAGAGEMVIIDKDLLERSNLNRVRGASSTDVGKNKAKTLKRFIADLGLPVSLAAYECNIDEDPAAVDALSSCDVVFGCTDDQIGREVLNLAVYIYALAFIDVGLGGQVVEANGEPQLRYHFGRVSTVLPEFGECLFCQGVITEQWIQHQYALREKPDLSPTEAAERYLQGGGEQAPGVGPFTSATADFGVATLFDLLKPFRRFSPELRRDAFRIDFVKMEFRSTQRKSDVDCPYCQTSYFLLAAERYRLNRPTLGKVLADV